MKILVACEFSGVVRRAFRERGHDAWSCDLLPAEDGDEHHLQCDVLTVLDRGWDLMVAHPPCTYLCAGGMNWINRKPEWRGKGEEAAKFVRSLMSAPIGRIAIENPVGRLSTMIRKPDQIVHPWQFGDEANKPTCFWLTGLPLLQPTKIVSKGEFYMKANGHRLSKWSHKTSGSKADRARIASRTFPGIAEAMATQWT